MLFHFFVLFASIHSEGINLQDVINEYEDSVTEIELQEGEYFARLLPLKGRTLTFIGREDKVVLDLTDSDVGAFDLDNSSLTLVSFAIRPSSEAVFAFGKQNSILNLTGCKFWTTVFSKPILHGIRSQLILNGTEIVDKDITCSIIEGPSEIINHHLALIVDNSKFLNLVIKAQKPVLAGTDVQNVTVYNTTFQDITCTEAGPLPTDQVQGVIARSVVMNSSSVLAVDGALSGGLVFGMQATYLTLANMQWIGGTNAVRFSNNVAFSYAIDVSIVASTFRNTSASEVWPNGGLLYLLQDTVKVKMSRTNIYSSSAPEGHGGFLFTTGRSTIIVDQCQTNQTSAGKCGGFIYAANHVETITLDLLTVTGSLALEDGGTIYMDTVKSFQANYGGFEKSRAHQQGGAIFFNNSDHSTINFANVAFAGNCAESDMGNDVLISYVNGSNYKVDKKNFVKCGSMTEGNKVTLLPHTLHADWTNSAWLDVKAVITGVVIGVCVFLAVCIVLTCVCCCCGVCVACGCGRKKADAYHHVEAQPTSHYAPAQQSPNLYPPPPAHPSQYPPQQYPQQTMYAQPVAQPAQFQQYPNLPPNQVGVDQSLSKT